MATRKNLRRKGVLPATERGTSRDHSATSSKSYRNITSHSSKAASIGPSKTSELDNSKPKPTIVYVKPITLRDVPHDAKFLGPSVYQKREDLRLSATVESTTKMLRAPKWESGEPKPEMSLRELRTDVICRRKEAADKAQFDAWNDAQKYQRVFGSTEEADRSDMEVDGEETADELLARLRKELRKTNRSKTGEPFDMEAYIHLRYIETQTTSIQYGRDVFEKLLSTLESITQGDEGRWSDTDSLDDD